MTMEMCLTWKSFGYIYFLSWKSIFHYHFIFSLQDQIALNISAEKLLEATRYFRADLFTEGHYSDVFRARIPTGRVAYGLRKTKFDVVIKRFRVTPHTQVKWQAEVTILNELDHPNVVKLLWSTNAGLGEQYLRDETCFLVYPYIPRGTLFENLRGRRIISDNWYGSLRYTKITRLDWASRLRIIRGIAEGIAYLHNRLILHGDIKSRNIVLDQSLNPIIIDFDMAVQFEEDQRYGNIMLQENWVHVAPSCVDGANMIGGTISLKCDIYGFGVVLMEILSARDPYNYDSSITLVQQFQNYDMIPLDVTLDSTVDIQEQAFQLFGLAKECTVVDRESRPTIDTVVQRLAGINS